MYTKLCTYSFDVCTSVFSSICKIYNTFSFRDYGPVVVSILESVGGGGVVCGQVHMGSVETEDVVDFFKS